MLKVRSPFMATDENGDEVFVSRGDMVSEISDAGPGSGTEAHHEGWNVTVRFTPKHKLWTELVTVDAIKLLKALEG